MIEIVDDTYYGREVFVCKLCNGSIEDSDIPTERIYGFFPIPMCVECYNPLNRPCGSCFERGCHGGEECVIYSP